MPPDEIVLEELILRCPESILFEPCFELYEQKTHNDMHFLAMSIGKRFVMFDGSAAR